MGWWFYGFVLPGTRDLQVLFIHLTAGFWQSLPFLLSFPFCITSVWRLKFQKCILCCNFTVFYLCCALSCFFSVLIFVTIYITDLFFNWLWCNPFTCSLFCYLFHFPSFAFFAFAHVSCVIVSSLFGVLHACTCIALYSYIYLSFIPFMLVPLFVVCKQLNQYSRSFAYLLASLKNAALAKTDISRWATIYHRFGAVLLMCWNKCWQLKYILTKPHQICSKTQLHQLMSVIAVAALLWVLLRSTSCALSERLEVV